MTYTGFDIRISGVKQNRRLIHDPVPAGYLPSGLGKDNLDDPSTVRVDDFFMPFSTIEIAERA
jgi:hypothetical protein